ncbi:MAG: DNA gyrase C-terminal beta-propeller domain-containing protein, partial [Solirubrobacterales bacterium]
RLKTGDEVVGLVIADETRTLLTICEHGHGKRTNLAEYRLQGRGGQGLIDIRTSERNGKVVNIVAVTAFALALSLAYVGVNRHRRAKQHSRSG